MTKRFEIGQLVRVKNSMLFTGRVGFLLPASGDPKDFWDYNVQLGDRIIGVQIDQIQAWEAS